MNRPPTPAQPMTCLVTGATGYVGGRLVPELLAAGYRVRCMARRAARLSDFPWTGQVEVAEADARDPGSLRRALTGVDVAYYLIHSLGSGAGFEAADRAAAQTFAACARDAGVGRIIYLGGLRPPGSSRLSPHLRSRAEVGDILLGSGVPTAVLRSGVIIGSGSVSFEMLRYLTERLPVMVTPKWVRSRTQPIAIRDVLRILAGCARLPPQVSRAFDIGGPDVLTYADMMRRYAAVAGLRPRLLLPVSVLTPWLSSHWVGLVTPVPAALARPLVESLRHDAVAAEHDIGRYVPDPPGGLTGFDDAVRLALQRIREASVTSRWTAASRPTAPADPLPTDPGWAGGSLYQDVREQPTQAPPGTLWQVIEAIGGPGGWQSWPLAWLASTWPDLAAGRAGQRRGRPDAGQRRSKPDPGHLRAGDALGCWRVESVQPGRLLRLRAETRLPGLTWLELSAGEHSGQTVCRQRVLFHPRGLAGQLYWHALLPLHAIVFGRMARNITRTAERRQGARQPGGASQ